MSIEATVAQTTPAEIAAELREAIEKVKFDDQPDFANRQFRYALNETAYMLEFLEHLNGSGDEQMMRELIGNIARKYLFDKHPDAESLYSVDYWLSRWQRKEHATDVGLE